MYAVSRRSPTGAWGAHKLSMAAPTPETGATRANGLSTRPQTSGPIGGLTPPARRGRGGFTLVELLVVISIFVVLTVMTIGAINLSSTSERVRGAARLVQSKIEGARDRAIYASRKTPDNPRPVGVRLLVDENEPSICTSLVYIQSPGNETSVLDTTDIDGDGQTNDLAVFAQLTDQVTGRYIIGSGLAAPPSWATLYDRGLIGSGSRIRILGGQSERKYTIHPSSFPVKGEAYYESNFSAFGTNDPNGNGSDDPVLVLIEQHPDAPPGGAGLVLSNPFGFSIELSPDVMPDEDALVLPRGTCIDLETSHLPDGWMTQRLNPTPPPLTVPQFSNRMDILFTAKGPATGDAAAAGIIHLHIVHLADALENALPGSPTVLADVDGNGTLEPVDRNGDELGITIFTRSGRTISHPVAFLDLHEPTLAVDDGIFYPPVGDLTPVFGSGTGQGEWVASTSYSADDVVAPKIYNGLIFRAVVAGTSDSYTLPQIEPKWNLAPGGLTQDNAVVWQSIKHDVWGLALEGEVAK